MKHECKGRTYSEVPVRYLSGKGKKFASPLTALRYAAVNFEKAERVKWLVLFSVYGTDCYLIVSKRDNERFMYLAAVPPYPHLWLDRDNVFLVVDKSMV
jgi:hypothetical protein